LTLAAESDALARALEKHRTLIAGETLARELRVVDIAEASTGERWELAPNVALRCSLEPA
jgi:hypothetical protein